MGNFTGFQKSDDFYIHPRLGQIKRIQKQEGPQLIEHKVVVQSEDMVTNWLNIISRLQNQHSSSFLFLPKGHYHQKIGYCGGNCEVFLLYDDFMFSLKDQIKNRKTIKRHFPESLLWQILLKLVKAGEALQKFKLKIGNVKTENILVNEQGQFRMVSQYSWPNTQNKNFNDIELQQKLYSPQELQKFQNIILRRPKSLNMERKTIFSKQNIGEDNTILTLSMQQEQQQISNEEIFSMGATLLQICTLEDSRQLYISVNKNKGKDKIDNNQIVINDNQIQRRLAFMKTKYSKPLVGIIAQMLKLNPQERVTHSDIAHLLAQHEDAILKHQSFVLVNNNGDQADSGSRLINNNLLSQGKNSQQIVKDGENKWGNLTNFFPFLRGMYEGKKLKKINRSGSSTHCGLRNFSLTKAH